jgi:Holliday junction DNA helicase RuvA
MIYAVHGVVEHTEPQLAVIDTGGVCYAVSTSLRSLARLKKGEEARLYTHFHISERACDLYGFISREELSSFRLLIGISGIGPKAALSVLSVTSPEKLALSVLTGDEKSLTAPGVGLKTRQRIILELKDKFSKTGKTHGTGDGALPEVSGGSPLSEAQSALCVLGYSPVEAAMAVKGIDESLPLEEIIRQSLKRMSL